LLEFRIVHLIGCCSNPSNLIGNFTSQLPTIFCILKSRNLACKKNIRIYLFRVIFIWSNLYNIYTFETIEIFFYYNKIWRFPLVRVSYCTFNRLLLYCTIVNVKYSKSINHLMHNELLKFNIA
jgi:hypothetical protein